MKTYTILQVQNGWVVLEGESYRGDGFIRKQWVFETIGALTVWLAKVEWPKAN